MLRLLIDENFDHAILRGLKSRLPQLDYVLVRHIGMSGFPDLELLRWAALEERVIVTHDTNTMTADANALLKLGERMAGVVVIPEQLQIGRAISDLEIAVECFSHAELTDQVKYLPF